MQLGNFSDVFLARHVSDTTEFRPDPAHKLSVNLYDLYNCCVYSEKLLMMDRETPRNM